MTKQEVKQLKDKLLKEALGFTEYGYTGSNNWHVDSKKWEQFQRDYFSRSGEIDGEKYSSKLNQHLSGTALLHLLDYLRNRIEKLLDAEE